MCPGQSIQRYVNRPIIKFLAFVLSVTAILPEWQRPFATHDGKQVVMHEAGLTIQSYGWTYYVDTRELNSLKDSAAEGLNIHDSDSKAALNKVSVKYFLLEPEGKILKQFRTNINLVVDAGVKPGRALRDYGESLARGVEQLLTNSVEKDRGLIEVNGIPIYFLDYEFDTPGQNGEVVRCRALAYMTIANGKGYVWTAVARAEHFNLKKPAIQMILGSIRLQPGSPANP